jgi:hypothetical protein
MIETTSLLRSLLPPPASGAGPGRQPRASSSSFEAQAGALRARVAKAAAMQADVAPRYANFSASGLTDEERDRIDLVVMDALNQAEDLLRALEQDLGSKPGNNVFAHRRGVAGLLAEQLREVQQKVNATRVLRQRHVMSGRDKLCPVIADSAAYQRRVDKPPAAVELLDADELQAIEYENKLLEDQLLSEFEEVRRIERNAHEVSHLLATFSEKVLEQHEMIGGLYEEAQQNVDIVSQIPTELHQATERSAGFRRIMLLVLLGLGVFLLVMDWMS